MPEHTEVVFVCQVNKPDAEVKWFKAGKPLKGTEKNFQIVKEENVHKLIIKDATKKEVTDYTAAVGKIQTKAKLTIKGMKHDFFFIVEACLVSTYFLSYQLDLKIVTCTGDTCIRFGWNIICCFTVYILHLLEMYYRSIFDYCKEFEQ